MRMCENIGLWIKLTVLAWFLIEFNVQMNNHFENVVSTPEKDGGSLLAKADLFFWNWEQLVPLVTVETNMMKMH